MRKKIFELPHKEGEKMLCKLQEINFNNFEIKFPKSIIK